MTDLRVSVSARGREAVNVSCLLLCKLSIPPTPAYCLGPVSVLDVPACIANHFTTVPKPNSIVARGLGEGDHHVVVVSRGSDVT